MPKPAKNSKGVAVTRQCLADTFGVPLTTVDGWTRRGCPAQQRGSRGVEWQFNTADVHRWLVDDAVGQATGAKDKDSEALALRKLRAQTELAELELVKARGDVISLEVAQQALSYAFSAVQARLRLIPGRVVRQLIGETDQSRFKDVLGSEIDESLEQLSRTDLTGLPEDELDEDEAEDEARE
jgi:phage terminase Nu1 subunit (DNA packaging protein)